jgi:hypothetical protein
MAVARYPWMFRAAAVVHVAFGLIWIWRFGLTSYSAEHGQLGVGLGVFSTLVGAFLFRRVKFAVALSALCGAFIAVSAAAAAPSMRGPVILAFAAIAIVAGLYAALSARALFERAS